MYFRITQIQICYFKVFCVELYVTPQVQFYLLGSYLLNKDCTGYMNLHTKFLYVLKFENRML